MGLRLFPRGARSHGKVYTEETNSPVPLEKWWEAMGSGQE